VNADNANGTHIKRKDWLRAFFCIKILILKFYQLRYFFLNVLLIYIRTLFFVDR
jgi:hypothetical protein